MINFCKYIKYKILNSDSDLLTTVLDSTNNCTEAKPHYLFNILLLGPYIYLHTLNVM